MDFSRFIFQLLTLMAVLIVATAQATVAGQGQFGNRGHAGNPINQATPNPYNPWAEYNPFSCQGRQPGYYADYSRACQRYYRCVQGYPQPFQFECGHGTRFDDRINNCNWPENVQCY